jgi:hypothetical protein
VDETEDGGVGANAEGENDYGRDSESGRFEKLTKSKLKVLDHMR